ncbi:MAG TPA: hypothetical protein VHP33_32920 [Polyangiaceae bacterium]|nr:hypothetical protein [Polyangiaceae bacterium]
MDPRSLGAFRIAFGLVLFSDLLRRWVDLRFWYTNSGLLPNHTLLWRPPSDHSFSLFFTVSTPFEAQLGFALCGVVYAMFLLGYRTRLAQLLALVARVSLNSRLAALENGGDMVMDLLCVLTLVLPLGARFSLDALAASVRAKAAEPAEPSELGASSSAMPRQAVTSLAVLGLLLQFATIYYFNAAAKNGAAWRSGDAVHYALHQDKLVTWFGVWMREHLPMSALHALTWGTLATEWLGFVLIITPVFVRQARLLAVCLMPTLHLGFALGLNLGGFSPAMMSFFPLLLTAEHWDGLSRRLGARLEPLGRRIEQLFAAGLGRFGVPSLPAPPKAWRVTLYRWTSEVAVALLLVAITSEVLNDNAPVPRALRFQQPAWMRAVIQYPRILQGWRMFASEPPRIDTMVYVAATTASGRRVDPYNEVASNQPYPAGDVVPAHLGQSQYFVMYSDRIGTPGYAAYRQAFGEWLLAYPERTGRADDCLLTYEVYLVSDRSPTPGGLPWPTPVGHERFMSYRAPNGTCRPVSSESAERPVAAR